MAAGDGAVMAVWSQWLSASFTSPFGGEVGAQRRVRGPLPGAVRREGPLTRPKRVDLSPEGRGEE
jgi:hypothetical protein